MSGILKHKDGDWSSKKAIALSMTAVVIFMILYAFFRGIHHPLGDSQTIIKLIEITIGSVVAICLETAAGEIFGKKGKV